MTRRTDGRASSSSGPLTNGAALQKTINPLPPSAKNPCRCAPHSSGGRPDGRRSRVPATRPPAVWPVRVHLAVVSRRASAEARGWVVAVRTLAACGYKAAGTDDGWSEPLPDGLQRWREDAIQALLNAEDAEVLFVAGCEENQGRFHAQFDHIILLSAAPGTLAERLAARTGNLFGKEPGNCAASLTTSGTLSRSFAGWPTTKSGQRCRWTKW
jgi:hypothetical protein